MIRFWNNDVFDNIDGVLQAALAALTEAEPQRIGPPQRAEVSDPRPARLPASPPPTTQPNLPLRPWGGEGRGEVGGHDE
jgi:hypothetical protein